MTEEEEIIVDFCKKWRERLTQIKTPVLTDEQLGQLITLNTTIYFIEEVR